MSILTVGGGGAYTTIASAVAASVAGDTIDVTAGTYAENIPTLRHDLTITGIGGAVTLMPPAGGLTNDKGLLVIDAQVTVVGLTFTGAAGPSGNDAGIRFETGGLVVRNCVFIGNQDGLLANDDPAATISITGSRFDGNGTGTGFTHNIYVGEVGTLSVTNSTISNVVGGNEIKSRADNTIITGDTINDGTQNANYAIDLPLGGAALVSGNTIIKGPNDPNHFVVHVGGEGAADPVTAGLTLVYANSSLTFTNNQVTSLLPASAQHPLLLDQAGDGRGGTVAPVISGNIFVDMPANQLVFGLSGGTLQYLAANSFVTSNVFVACYASGTRIATPAGMVAIEALRVGSPVLSAFGGRVEVVWMGWQVVNCRTHPRPAQVWPVRVRAHALGARLPARDLLLSPDHAIFVEDVLIPVRCLIDEVNIVQEAVDTVTYYHVELPVHDVLLAEGLPAESYLDVGNWGAFANGVGGDLDGDAGTIWAAQACAPQITGGAVLEKVRERLRKTRTLPNPAKSRGPLNTNLFRPGRNHSRNPPGRKPSPRGQPELAR